MNSAPSRYELRGRVVFITGAASGIGAATTLELARRGARLLLLDRDAAALQALTRQIDATAIAVPGDVTSTADLDRAVAAGLAAFGAIDIVWANAGIASFGPLAQTDPAAWRRCIEVNLLGSFEAVHAALPHVMQRRGMVVVTASAASFAQPPGMSAYAASKAGLDALCNALRLELGPHGVNVLTLYPSWIHTPLLGAMAPVSAFAALRRAMPWPLGSTAPVAPLARRIADAIERRQRRLFAPRWVGLMETFRGLLHTRALEAPLQQAALRVDGAFRQDVARLGRPAASGGASVNPGPSTSDPPSPVTER